MAGIGATAWLIMIMQLTGNSRLINRRLLLALSVIPLTILFLNWSENPLFRSNYYLDSTGMLHWSEGPIFWFGLIYLNALFLVPLYFLWYSNRRISILSLKQTLALSLSGVPAHPVEFVHSNGYFFHTSDQLSIRRGTSNGTYRCLGGISVPHLRSDSCCMRTPH